MSGGRGRKRRIATNVYEDDLGRIGVAQVGPLRKDKRFSKDTPRAVIQAWIDATRKEFRKQRTRARRLKGTLAEDVATYLAELPAGRSKNDTTSLLAAWVAALGAVRRSTLTEARLRAVVLEWQQDGIAASTINHRRQALVNLITTLDGRDAPNIARALKRQREPDAEPRAVPMALLDAIIDSMDAHRSSHPGRGGRGFRNKSHARLKMMLWTGITPASLKRLTARAIDLEQRTMTLPSRVKGAGAESVTVPLFPQGVEACRAWLRAFAWGRFDHRALGRAFHRAVKAYVASQAAAGRAVDVPADLRPYDLRHSFLSWVWQVTRDPLLVQHFAQHADLKTTRRYTRGVVDARARSAVASVTTKSDNETAE